MNYQTNVVSLPGQRDDFFGQDFVTLLIGDEGNCKNVRRTQVYELLESIETLLEGSHRHHLIDPSIERLLMCYNSSGGRTLIPLIYKWPPYP